MKTREIGQTADPLLLEHLVLPDMETVPGVNVVDECGLALDALLRAVPIRF